MAKIVEAQHSVLLLGGHNYFVLLDDNGQRIDEIHGFAKDSAGNVTTTSMSGTVFVMNSVTLDYSSASPQATVAQGTMAEMQNLWAAAQACGQEINGQTSTYAMFPGTNSYNSNSVASTLAACMAVPEASLGSYTPGAGIMILSQAVIQSIQSVYGLGGGGEEDPKWPEETTEGQFRSEDADSMLSDAGITLVGVHNILDLPQIV